MRGTKAVAGAAILMVLAGCAPVPPGPAMTSAIGAPTPSPAQAEPLGPPELDPMTFAVSCTYEDPSLYDWRKAGSSPLDAVVRANFAAYEDAWESGEPWESCTGGKSGGKDYTSEQLAAVQTAEYGIESLGLLYGLCAETAGPYVTSGPVSEGQQKEIAGMLIICPDFPAAAQLRAASAAAQQAEAERVAGLRFWGSRVYVVGTDVQPGTYQATGTIQNCYWARLDAAAKVIDNNFVPAATQVQVTIEPTDFSLDIEGGCGEFVKIG